MTGLKPYRLSKYRLIRPLILLLMVLIFVTACSGSKQEVMKTVFFPPLPDEPRLQFLTAFGDSSILEDTSMFKSLVSGMDRPDIQTRLLKPYGIALYNGVIYVCDTVPNTVYRIDIKAGKFESIRGNAGSGGLKKPVSLTVDEGGRLYVADTIRKEVLLYTADGDFIQAFGRGILKKPSSVAVDKENLYVLDYDDGLIKVLDRKTGAFIREFGKDAEPGNRLVMPAGLAIDSQGFLYVTNVANGKVIKLDRDGNVLLSFGKLGDFLGEFTRPKGIAVDKEGRIYVVDGGNQNVQIFNAERVLLIPFGSPGLPRGSLNLPAGITLTTDVPDYFRQFIDPSFEVELFIFVTNQSGANKITVYGLGRYKGTLPAAPVKPAATPDKGGSADGAAAPR